MFRSSCIICVLIVGFGTANAQQFRLFGLIHDAASGELLSGATVTVKGSSEGAISNAYGYYILHLPAGEHLVQYSYVGYESRTQILSLSADTQLDIRLAPAVHEIGEVTVQAKRSVVTATGVDVSRLNIKDIRDIPAFLGEPDVLRSLQSLPGVGTSHHGTVNMSVRGGAYSHNLVLLDEAPVFNPAHILGFMSSFNPDAISTVDLYKGVPARYGSKLASVVDIRMKEGNRERLGVAGGIGLISSRLVIENPLWKGKGSFMVAGRYCYAGSTAKMISEVKDLLPFGSNFHIGKSNKMWFYDVNAKVNYTIDAKNRIYLSGYNGFDRFFVPDFSGEYLLEWGNLNGTLRWNHVVNPSLFINTLLIVSRFGYSHYLTNDGGDFRWDASLGQIELKSDAGHTLTNRLKLRYGVSLTGYGFRPGEISPRRPESPVKGFSLARKRSLETGLYAESDWEILSGLSANAGLRLSTFSNIGPGVVYDFYPYNRLPVDSALYGSGKFMKTFAHLQPRISLRYQFGQGTTLKLSYANMVQYLHKASNSTLGMPTDIWFSASQQALPQLAHQFSAGYQLLWGKGYTFSIEPYYKRMLRQVDFRDNADLFVNPYLEAEIFSGNGTSKGIELMLEKMEGRITGRISYTLSETRLKIQGVNNGNSYAAPYDSRHNLSAYVAFRLNAHFTFSADFKYATGRPVTIPTGGYLYLGLLVTTYSGRNEYRIADFHELNLTIRWQPRNDNRKFRGTWTLSVMNVYNRKNVFGINMEKPIYTNAPDLQTTMMYLYGILPTVGYEFKF